MKGLGDLKRKIDVTVLRERLLFYYNKYEKGTLKKEELKSFCKLMVVYCKETRHADAILQTPSVNFEKLTDDGFIKGQYQSGDNRVIINEEFLDSILSKGEDDFNLEDLIGTIGHEMTHYHQNSNFVEYETLSADEQQKIDKGLKESIDAFKNYFYLDRNGIKTLTDLIVPYRGGFNVSEERLDEFYDVASYASYYTVLSEKEAREEGVDFALSFCENLEKRNRKVGDFEYKKSYINEQRSDIRYQYVRNKKIVDNFSTYFNIDSELLLKIVGDVESKEGALKYIDKNDYLVAMKFIIKGKTKEQKQELLRNAIYNGFSQFARVILDSFQKDIDFKANKDNLSKYVGDCLTGEAYENADFKLNSNICTIDYSKILNQKDFERVVTNVMQKKPNNARDFFKGKSSQSISLDSILKWQEHLYDKMNSSKTYFESKFDVSSASDLPDDIFNLDGDQKAGDLPDDFFKVNNPSASDLPDDIFNLDSDIKTYDLPEDYFSEFDFRWFFETLFDVIKVEDKISYLKCGKLRPEVKKILVESLQNELNLPESIVKTLKDEESIINFDYTIKNKATTEDTHNKSSNADDFEIGADFVVDESQNIETNQSPESNSQIGKDETLRQKFDISTEQGMNNLLLVYAASNKAYYSTQKRTPEDIKRRQNINEQMKIILQNKLKDENDLETGLDLNLFIETNFSDSLIEEVAKSKTATLELFYIMASGMYNKDGNKIRLTQKQKQSLARVLERINEKRLEIDSPQKVENTQIQEKTQEIKKVLE